MLGMAHSSKLNTPLWELNDGSIFLLNSLVATSSLAKGSLFSTKLDMLLQEFNDDDDILPSTTIAATSA